MIEEVRRSLTVNDKVDAKLFPVRQGKIYYSAKRIMDLVVAGGLILVLLPLILLIALAIILYSPGPVFYKQKRVGVKRHSNDLNPYWERTTFQCYKFRTMHVNNDSSIHREYVHALIKNDDKKMIAMQGKHTTIRKLTRDPRVTRPGRFLRKLSLDELPQLWNVIRGDMSMVGPRPAIPYELEVYQPWHLKRFGAQPGITGLQQVMARSTASFDQQVNLDLEYIKHQSIWLDLKIMFKTPFVVVSTKGAE